MEVREKLVIGRKWNNPEIYTHIDVNKIELGISMENLVHALAQEVDKPALIMTKAQLEKRLQIAMTKVLSEIKRCSTEVV